MVFYSLLYNSVLIQTSSMGVMGAGREALGSQENPLFPCLLMGHYLDSQSSDTRIAMMLTLS